MYPCWTELVPFLRICSCPQVLHQGELGYLHVYLTVMQDYYLFWECLQLIFGIDILPDTFHVIPVFNNTMFHWVSNGHEPSVFLLQTNRNKSNKCLDDDSHSQQKMNLSPLNKHNRNNSYSNIHSILILLIKMLIKKSDNMHTKFYKSREENT